MFQSTHPCGVRQEQFIQVAKVTAVSIHAPVWGATRIVRLLGWLRTFQSTHPCGVRRPYQYRCQHRRVSIHTPVWGATYTDAQLQTIVLVSIHAPVWGATNTHKNRGNHFEFQSTHPCGVRLLFNLLRLKQDVSIHAPVWGATVVSSIQSAASSFNPRTRVGCD